MGVSSSTLLKLQAGVDKKIKINKIAHTHTHTHTHTLTRQKKKKSPEGLFCSPQPAGRREKKKKVPVTNCLPSN